VGGRGEPTSRQSAEERLCFLTLRPALLKSKTPNHSRARPAFQANCRLLLHFPCIDKNEVTPTSFPDFIRSTSVAGRLTHSTQQPPATRRPDVLPLHGLIGQLSQSRFQAVRRDTMADRRASSIIESECLRPLPPL
jgi:hypothetical protein